MLTKPQETLNCVKEKDLEFKHVTWHLQQSNRFHYKTDVTFQIDIETTAEVTELQLKSNT